MADVLYPKYREALLTGNGPNLSSAAVKALLVDGADYTYSATHEFLSDVPSGARVATSGALANKTVASGVFDADDATFASVTGDPTEIVVLFVDTGVEGTSRLLAYWDTGSVTLTPNGGGATLTWSSGAAKIFAL